jgi:hypothetical protein
MVDDLMARIVLCTLLLVAVEKFKFSLLLVVEIKQTSATLILQVASFRQGKRRECSSASPDGGMFGPPCAVAGCPTWQFFSLPARLFLAI